MISKFEEKEKAIKLRKEGFSYSEILKKIPIAKSTLSLWLQSVGLAQAHPQRNTEKRRAGGLRGAATRRRQRLAITQRIKEEAKKEIQNINERDLWILGIALHWAEGGKEKSYRPGSGLRFDNSDPRMILLFIKWLKMTFNLDTSSMSYGLYIHETANEKDALRYWSRIMNIPIDNFKVYFKRNKIKTLRRNTGENYHGLIRIYVKRSSSFNRRIDGWIEGICEKYNCGVV